MNELSILAFLPCPPPVFIGAGSAGLVFLPPGEIPTAHAGNFNNKPGGCTCKRIFKKLHEILNKILNMNKLYILAFLLFPPPVFIGAGFFPPRRAGTGAGTVLYFPPMLLPRHCRPLLIFIAPKNCS